MFVRQFRLFNVAAITGAANVLGDERSNKSLGEAPATSTAGFVPPSGPRVVRCRPLEQSSTVKCNIALPDGSKLPMSTTTRNFPTSSASTAGFVPPSGPRVVRCLPLSQSSTVKIKSPSSLIPPSTSKIPRRIQLPKGFKVTHSPYTRLPVRLEEPITDDSAVDDGDNVVDTVPEPNITPPNVSVEIPLHLQVKRALDKALCRMIPMHVERAVRAQMSRMDITPSISVPPHELGSSQVLEAANLQNENDFADKIRQIEENESKVDRLQRLAKVMEEVRREHKNMPYDERRKEAEDRLAVRMKQRITAVPKAIAVPAELPSTVAITPDAAVELVESMIPDAVDAAVQRRLHKTIAEVATTPIDQGPLQFLPQLPLSIIDLDDADNPKFPFRFELAFYPNIGNVMVYLLPNGKCLRFTNVDHEQSTKQGYRILRCQNCKSTYDGAANRGKEKKDRGFVQSYAYTTNGDEPNSFRLLEDPNTKHNDFCIAKQPTLGAHGVQYLFNAALFDYRQNPIGTPFQAFCRCYQAVPANMARMFPTANERDWRRAMPTWFSRSSPWHQAFSASFPKFDWQNPAPEFLYTRMGQVSGPLFEEKFIYHGVEDEKFLFCCSLSAARIIHSARVLTVDGTFKAVSGTAMKGYTQLFSMHARHPSGENRVVATCLMKDKLKTTYQKFFHLIRMRITEATGDTGIGNVKVIMADWEPAITYAVAEEFPGVKRKYCCFHYGQSIVRNLGFHGLLKSYRDGCPYIVPYVNEVLGGMLIPQRVMHLYAKMLEKAPFHPDPKIQLCLQGFAKYVWTNYLKTDEMRARLDAFDTEEGDPRTSNSQEGWHNMLYRSKRIGGANISVILSALVDCDFETFIRWDQLDSGMRAKYRKEKYVELDESIRIAKANFLAATDPKINPNLTEDELLVLTRRYARNCSFLLGGSVHKKLTDKTQTQLQAEKDAATVIRDAEYRAAHPEQFAQPPAGDNDDRDKVPNDYLLNIDDYDYGGNMDMLIAMAEEEYYQEAGYDEFEEGVDNVN